VKENQVGVKVENYQYEQNIETSDGKKVINERGIKKSIPPTKAGPITMKQKFYLKL